MLIRRRVFDGRRASVGRHAHPALRARIRHSDVLTHMVYPTLFALKKASILAQPSLAASALKLGR